MSTSATVSFYLTWVTNPATTPPVSVTGPSPTRAGQVAKGGSFNAYAGGRIRVITTPVDMRTYPVTLQMLTDPQLLLLQQWRGLPLLLRDPVGRRVWGSYLDVQWTDIGKSSATSMWHDATFTFTELVGYAEGV